MSFLICMLLILQTCRFPLHCFSIVIFLLSYLNVQEKPEKGLAETGSIKCMKKLKKEDLIAEKERTMSTMYCRHEYKEFLSSRRVIAIHYTCGATLNPGRREKVL